MSKLIYCPTCGETEISDYFDNVDPIGWPRWHPLYCAKYDKMLKVRDPELEVKYSPLIPFKGTIEEENSLYAERLDIITKVDEFVQVYSFITTKDKP